MALGLNRRGLGMALCLAALAALVAAFLVGDAARAATPARIRIEGAIVRLPAAPGRPAAGYMTLTNTGPRADALVAVTSPDAERVELHRTTATAGVMRMGSVARVDLAPGATVRLAPGGLHLMLFGLRATDATVRLELAFASGATVGARARAIPPGGDAHAGMGH